VLLKRQLLRLRLKKLRLLKKQATTLKHNLFDIP
jgi:hypothetical protein